MDLVQSHHAKLDQCLGERGWESSGGNKRQPSTRQVRVWGALAMDYFKPRLPLKCWMTA